ncbi:hypothetical protein SAY87_029901 [Trapa incisa]|uniref:Uncharacterized protein n=1 Tax=Trapa incisa TaxID=236973 RepID=A0AAN7Q9Q1_9MYRT|nr:hypothetical protein SAY87_029901 [Trapa incisa]
MAWHNAPNTLDVTDETIEHIPLSLVVSPSKNLSIPRSHPFRPAPTETPDQTRPDHLLFCLPLQNMATLLPSSPKSPLESVIGK